MSRLKFFGSGFLYGFFEIFDFLGDSDGGDMGTGAGFVEGVDGLVGEVAVADIAVGEFHAGFEGSVGV